MNLISRLAVTLTIGIISPAHAEIHTTWQATEGSMDSTLHGGSYGSITFDDWGFTGPNGRTATDFSSVNGFGNGNWDASNPEYCIANPSACNIGQMQHVVTTGPDWNTPDNSWTAQDDVGGGNTYANANVDSTTTFYKWAYTSTAGSTFNNMLIDYDGDYHIDQNDMNFNWYNAFEYQQVIPEGGTRVAGSQDDGTVYNTLAFKPYALSDATGWCGSVVADHPNAHEAMAGQVTFDFAFDVYFVTSGGLSYSSTEIVRNFEMRSYGDIFVDVTTSGGDQQLMSARAVVNNTDPSIVNQSVGPDTPTGDPDLWHNKVSFMGAGVVPGSTSAGECGILTTEWASGQQGGTKFASLLDGIANYDACTAAGGSWQKNAYAGYGFILRADADRSIDYFDESVYGADPMLVSAVPIPAAIWLFGSGLVGLIGFARRKA